MDQRRFDALVRSFAGPKVAPRNPRRASRPGCWPVRRRPHGSPGLLSSVRQPALRKQPRRLQPRLRLLRLYQPGHRSGHQLPLASPGHMRFRDPGRCRPQPRPRPLPPPTTATPVITCGGVSCLPGEDVCLVNGSCAETCVCGPNGCEPACPEGCGCGLGSVEGAHYCVPVVGGTCAEVPPTCVSTANCPVGQHCQVLPCGPGGANESRCAPLC